MGLHTLCSNSNTKTPLKKKKKTVLRKISLIKEEGYKQNVY